MRSLASGPAYRRWRERHVGALYERIWREAADAIGAELVGRRGAELELRLGGRTTFVRREQTRLDDDNADARARAFDMSLATRPQADNGVPVPASLELSATDPRRAFAFRRGAGATCVVKPSQFGGGFGVTCGVRSRNDLARAWLAAARYSRRLVIKRELAGDVYRVLVLDGKPLGVVRRQPSQVIGNGRSSIGVLLDEENRRRLHARGTAGIWLIRFDLDLVLTLRRQGLTLAAVPPVGTVVTVKSVTGDAGARETEVMQVGAASGLVDAAVRAAAIVGVRLAGVDIVASDPRSPLTSRNGGVLEVNASPGLHHHYLVSNPASICPVAVPVLRCLLEE